MKSLADGLPPEIARQIHPDWRQNEAAYWAARDQIIQNFGGQWIGFADGKVVASGPRPVVVFHAAHLAAAHPFLICVGHEDEPYRMRRVRFPYDKGYPGEALPVMPVEFRSLSAKWIRILPDFNRIIPSAGERGRPSATGLVYCSLIEKIDGVEAARPHGKIIGRSLK